MVNMAFSVSIRRRQKGLGIESLISGVDRGSGPDIRQGRKRVKIITFK
jgi:hypothetical protein